MQKSAVSTGPGCGSQHSHYRWGHCFHCLFPVCMAAHCCSRPPNSSALQAARKSLSSPLPGHAMARPQRQPSAAAVAAWALCLAAEQTCRCGNPKVAGGAAGLCVWLQGNISHGGSLPKQYCAPSPAVHRSCGSCPCMLALRLAWQPVVSVHVLAPLALMRHLACAGGGHCQALSGPQLPDARLPPAGNDGGGPSDTGHAVRLQGAAQLRLMVATQSAANPARAKRCSLLPCGLLSRLLQPMPGLAACRQA